MKNQSVAEPHPPEFLRRRVPLVEVVCKIKRRQRVVPVVQPRLRAYMGGLYLLAGLHRTVDRALQILPIRRPAECNSDVSTDPADDEPDSGLGPILQPVDAPVLFHMLEKLARRQGGGYPTEVRVCYLPACGVLDLGMNTGRPHQVLIIGLPCLQIWTVQELGAVLAHEMAHLKQDHAAFTREILNYSKRLSAEGRAGSWLNPRCALARVVGRSLALLSAPISRSLEYQADLWSADCFGAAALASAIEKLAVVEPVFREILVTYDPITDRDDHIYAYFARVWSRLRVDHYKTLRQRLVRKLVHDPDDPHPPLQERLARLPRQDRFRFPSPVAWRLLRKRKELALALHNHLYGARQEKPSVFVPARQ